jgi:hypothetical protein
VQKLQGWMASPEPNYDTLTNMSREKHFNWQSAEQNCCTCGVPQPVGHLAQNRGNGHKLAECGMGHIKFFHETHAARGKAQQGSCWAGSQPLREAMATQHASHEQHLRRMQAESASQMPRLAAETASAMRNELEENDLVDIRDMHAKHRMALGKVADRLGRPSWCKWIERQPHAQRDLAITRGSRTSGIAPTPDLLESSCHKSDKDKLTAT